jgi:C1A family cysteine protease
MPEMRAERPVIKSTIGGATAMNVLLNRLYRMAAKMVVTGMVLVPAGALAQADVHGTGYEPDPPDLASVPHVPRFRAFLPAFKDLSPMFPPPGNQGRQSSCVAWSVGYSLRGYYYRQRTHVTGSDPSTLFSPSYIYNQLVKTPDCSGGSNIKAALELIRTEGIATMADFPYDDRSCIRRPNDQIKQHAASNVIVGYRPFSRGGELHLDDVKGSLLAGDPVEVGLNIDNKALSNLKRGQIYDRDGPATFDGHAVVVTGFDDRIQAFKIINSWGTKWADDGFGWISYRAFAENTHAAYVLNDSSQVTPPPTPDPTPTPTPTPVPTPVPVPASGVDLASLGQMIDAQSQGFVCSRVSFKQLSPTDAMLRGWVSTQANLDTLNDLLRSVQGGLHVDAQLLLRPWPQCEAMITLVDGMSGDHGLTLATVDHDGSDFEAGSKLILQVKTPDFPSYLYVTYLPASGDAVLLYKPRGTVPQALPPKSVVDLGGGRDPRVFKVGPPFGPEMVIAVATASPLFTDGIPASQTERDYLTALRKTLLYKPDPNQPDRVVDASAIALTTKDRSP